MTPAHEETASSALEEIDAASSYIYLVQHLIEKCLLFTMDRQQCAEALASHANIKPAVTIAVWNELEKENKEFFSSYFRTLTEGRDQITLEGTAAELFCHTREGQGRLIHYHGTSPDTAPTD